jgi:hypothetical protein
MARYSVYRQTQSHAIVQHRNGIVIVIIGRVVQMSFHWLHLFLVKPSSPTMTTVNDASLHTDTAVAQDKLTASYFPFAHAPLCIGT